jgi:hypothetical protein
MAQHKAAMRIDIGKWIEVQRNGFDPVQITISTLHEQLNHVPGIAEMRWSAGVWDFGGQRFLPFDPLTNVVAPFGTVFIDCLLIVTTENGS